MRMWQKHERTYCESSVGGTDSGLPEEPSMDDASLSQTMLVPLRLLLPGYGGDSPSGKRQVELEPAASGFRLPNDWIVREVPRCDGSRVDKYYYEPGSGQRFRSLRAVERYISGEAYTPTPKALKLGNDFKSPGSWKMVVSGGKMLSLDEERSNQFQLAVVSPKVSDAISHIKLPDGWIVEGIPRRGTSCTDKYYYEPGTGQKFRSLISVERHLDEMTENTPLAEAFKLGDHFKKSVCKKKINSREKMKSSTFDSAIPPVKINWVLASPEGDTWSPFMGELKVPDPVKQQWTERFILSINNGNCEMPNS